MNSRPQTCSFNILLKHWRNCRNANCIWSTVRAVQTPVPLRFPCFLLPCSTSKISFATSFSCHCTGDLRISCRQNLSSSTQNMWKAPREICLQKKRRIKNSCKKSTLAKRDLCTLPHIHCLRHKSSTLLMICHDMSWYGTSHLVISCHDMSVKTLKLTKPAPWGKMDTNSEFCPCIPASKRHWWPQHGGKWWKFLQVVNLRSTEWKYKGSDTRIPSNIAGKKIFQQLAEGTSLAEHLERWLTGPLLMHLSENHWSIL